jgi:hypothetical protein
MAATGKVSRFDLRPKLVPRAALVYEAYWRLVQLGEGTNLPYSDVRAWVERRTGNEEDQAQLEELLYRLLGEHRRVAAAQLEEIRSQSG